MLPDWVGKYVGLPYKTHGRGPDGWDCWGFVRHIYQREFGIELPSYDELYADEPEIDAAVAAASNQQMPYEEVEQSDICTGDVVFLKSFRGVAHVGMVLDRAHFIHCNSHAEYSTIERLDHPLWRNRIIGFFRHKEFKLEDG